MATPASPDPPYTAAYAQTAASTNNNNNNNNNTSSGNSTAKENLLACQQQWQQASPVIIMNATHPLKGQPLLKTKGNNIISDIINQRTRPPPFVTNIEIILYDNKTHQGIKSATYLLNFTGDVAGGITIGDDSGRMSVNQVSNTTGVYSGSGGYNRTGSSSGSSSGSLISGLFHTKGEALNLVIIHNSSLTSTTIIGDTDRLPLDVSQGVSGQGSFLILTPALQQNHLYRLHVVVVGVYYESCILDTKQQLHADFTFLAGSNAQGRVPRGSHLLVN